MFEDAKKEKAPMVIVRKPALDHKTINVDTLPAQGIWRRVMVTTERERRAVLFAPLHEERFAPARGDGILISESFWRTLKEVKL